MSASVLRRVKVLLLAAMAAAAGGCSDTFDPRSRLTDARVLALVADPLELGPQDTVVLRPFTWFPPGDGAAAHQWTFCPFTLGSGSSYACAFPACEVPLAAGPDGVATASPMALAQACLDAVRASGGTLPPGIPSQIPARIDLAFKYRVTTTAGTVRDAIALVPFFAGGAPEPRNVAPVVERVEIGGTPLAPFDVAPALRSGGALELRVVLDPASAQPFQDELGNSAVESLVVSYFSTAGKLQGDRADGPDARQTLEGDELGSGAEAEVWMVARDLRGGQTVVGPYRVPIAR